MGAAILLIYVPTFLVIATISLLIGKYISRKTREPDETKNKRNSAFITGGILSLTLTTIYTWWPSNKSPLDDLFTDLIVSLLGTPIIGLIILLAASILWLTGAKKTGLSLFRASSGALQSAVFTPFFIIIITTASIQAYRKILSPIIFKNLCKDAKIEIIEKPNPPQSLSLISKDGNYPARLEIEWLLLAENTPLKIIEIVENTKTGGKEYFNISLRENHEKTPMRHHHNEVFYKKPSASLNSEYHIKYSKTEIPFVFNILDEMSGDAIQIERVYDKKIIASAKYYWNEDQNKTCPEHSNRRDFLIKFIAEIFNLPIDKNVSDIL